MYVKMNIIFEQTCNAINFVKKGGMIQYMLREG